MYLAQELSGGRSANLQAVLTQTPFFLLATWCFIWLMFQWESPILAIRTADLIAENDILDNVASIEGVGDIVGSSWLVRALYWLWPALILFVSYGFTRAFLGLENAIQQTPVDASDAPSETDRAPDRAAVLEGADGAEVPLQTSGDATDAHAPEPARQQSHGGNGDGRGPHPRIPELEPIELPGGDNGGNGRGHGGDDPGVQELLEQLETERRERSQAERERDALVHSQAVNPLTVPNRGTRLPQSAEPTAEGDDEHV